MFDADLVGGMRPAGSTACDDPCNVISGNTGPAVVSSRTEEIQILGNFIGTDPGGRIAVPNGTANGDAAVVASFAGGPSDAASGVCDLACNLISGNAGPGAALTNGAYNSEDLLQGNVIGETIDGLPLANAGAGVEVGPANAGVLVGGDGNLGNVIAHNGGPGVSVPSLLVDNRPAIVGNSITGNGGGIVYGSSPAYAVTAVPVFSRVAQSGAGLVVQGNVTDLVQGGSFTARVDVYGSSSCEVGPQGAVPLGHVSIGPITDGSWEVDVPTLAPGLKVITATSTRRLRRPRLLPELGVSTTVAQASAAGATEVEVASTNGWQAGDYAQIAAPSGTVVRKVAGIGSLIFAAPLPEALPVGTAIVQVQAPGGDTDPPAIDVVRPAERGDHHPGRAPTPR